MAYIAAAMPQSKVCARRRVRGMRAWLSLPAFSAGGGLGHVVVGEVEAGAEGAGERAQIFGDAVLEGLALVFAGRAAGVRLAEGQPDGGAAAGEPGARGVEAIGADDNGGQD